MVQKSIEWLKMPDYVSCLVLEKTGNLVAAFPDGLYRVDFENEKYVKMMHSNLPEGIRFNDGKCDKDGRLWIGSMQMRQDENAEYAGALFCIEDEKIKSQYPDYTIPNGLAWDDEKSFFYHVATPTRKIDQYVIRTDGNLWIAMWGGSKVICASPESGEVLKEIRIPDKNVSCCTFGGENLNHLFVTTARDENGNGGELYRIELNMKGKSALMIFDKHANLKYKFGNRNFWSEGYYVSTVGLNEATIRKYIQEQEKSDVLQDKLSVKEYEDPFKG